MLTGQSNLVALRERSSSRSEQWTALLALREDLVTRDSGDRRRSSRRSRRTPRRGEAAIETLRRELAALNEQSHEL